MPIHYQHYLHYSNMFVATGMAYICYRLKHGLVAAPWLDLAFLMLEVIFFAGSRDTLRRYYTRAAQVLGTQQPK